MCACVCVCVCVHVLTLLSCVVAPLLQGDLKAPDMEMDPREAILRHADKKDVFSHFTAAYAATQPKPIYAQEEEEEEEES